MMKYNYSQFASEKQLYEFVKEFYIDDLTNSESSTSRYDCTSEKYNIDIELKCRRKHYDELLIEKAKYDSLIKRSKELGTTAVYINSTPEGVWGFYLNECDIEWSTRDLPKQTDFSRRHKVPKVVGYLNVNDGIDLLSLLPSV